MLIQNALLFTHLCLLDFIRVPLQEAGEMMDSETGEAAHDVVGTTVNEVRYEAIFQAFNHPAIRDASARDALLYKDGPGAKKRWSKREC